MINAKNILLLIIAIIILKVGLDYTNTLNAVTQANDNFSGNKKSDAALRTAYGTSDSEKIKQIKDKNKKSKSIMTDNTMLTISGKIDKDTGYMIETQYTATSDVQKCKKFQRTGWSSDTVAIGESFEYYPKIEGTHHQIKIPLKLFNPNERCKIKIKRIFIIIFNRKNKIERNRMVLYTSVKEEYAVHGFYKSWHSTYKINMECLEPGPSEGTHYTPCTFGSLSSRFSIMGVIPNKYFDVELNIKKIPLESLTKEKLHYILTGDKNRR